MPTAGESGQMFIDFRGTVYDVSEVQTDHFDHGDTRVVCRRESGRVIGHAYTVEECYHIAQQDALRRRRDAGAGDAET